MTSSRPDGGDDEVQIGKRGSQVRQILKSGGAIYRRRVRDVAHRVHGSLVVSGGRERGDVPGWVLVTLMTAGLVLALWAIAGPALSDVFSDSIQRVTGEIGG